MERRIQRAVIDLQHVLGVRANGDADAVAVLRPPLQRPENQEIQRALQQVDAFFLCPCHR